MATALEVGKISATTFLYRYWKKTALFLRVYLSIAILVLMGITSMGIFGWLTAAYQTSALQYEIGQQEIVAMGEQKGLLQTQAEVAKKRVDNLVVIRNSQEKRLNDTLENPTIAYNPTQLRQIQEQNSKMIRDTESDIKAANDKYSSLLDQSSDIDRKIIESKLGSIKSKDVITFKFVAEAFGVSLNTMVKWFTILIISVFDPLAISLILAYNVSLVDDDSAVKEEEPIKNLVEVKEEPVKKKWLRRALRL